METFCLVLGMALVTFSLRYLLLPFSERIRFPRTMQRALRYVPPAVLTAIIVPSVFFPNGTALQLTLTNPYMAGALLTTVIGWFSKSMPATILGGMACFALLQWVLNLS
jgi:branched-subunit amino acid transport protein